MTSTQVCHQLELHRRVVGAGDGPVFPRRGITVSTGTTSSRSRPITVTRIRVGDLLAEDSRMPINVHLIDHPDGRVLVDTGLTQLHPEAADMDPRITSDGDLWRHRGLLSPAGPARQRRTTPHPQPGARGSLAHPRRSALAASTLTRTTPRASLRRYGRYPV